MYSCILIKKSSNSFQVYFELLVVEQYAPPPLVLDSAVRTLAAMSKCCDITFSPRTNRGIDFDARSLIQRTDARLQPSVLVLYQLGLRHDTAYESDSYGIIVLPDPKQVQGVSGRSEACKDNQTVFNSSAGGRCSGSPCNIFSEYDRTLWHHLSG